MLRALRRMEKKHACGVYFIFKSMAAKQPRFSTMQQGWTFRISVPKYPTQDANHRILAHQTSRFTHYYFYVRDPVLGPIIIRMASRYGLNQLCYDLRKLKGHGLLARDGRRYAYRLTTKGLDVALLFLFFHKRLCGPLAYSRFHHKPDPEHRPNSKLEAAYHKADVVIENIVKLLQAA